MQASTTTEPAAFEWSGSPEGNGAHPSIDMAALLLGAYEIGDMVKQSVEVAEYEYWKQTVEADPAVGELLKKFAKAKDLFEECQRFGRFHPDFHAAKDKAEAIGRELDAIESVSRYKQAEQAVDELLTDIARQIAGSVSNSIKVPDNNPLPSGGCGSGGSCSCGSGGCG